MHVLKIFNFINRTDAAIITDFVGLRSYILNFMDESDEKFEKFTSHK